MSREASAAGAPEHPPPTADRARSEGLPRHVAMIMDGNGRWAHRRGQPRVMGHRKGANAVRTVVTEAARLGLEALTLYTFSNENWKRPESEVEQLLELCGRYLVDERPTLQNNDVRLRHIGQRAGLPDALLARLDETLALTAENRGLQLVLALNYGARSEITEAARGLARRAAAGELDPEAITPEILERHLYTADLPDPDLLIRTAGERRLSNYLLWQLSYAELYVTDLCWPDFGKEALQDALADFARRRRKFGAV